MIKILLPALCLLVAVSNSSFGQVRLPRLVRDSMVLQRDVKTNIWGWAASGEKVTVKFQGKKFVTTTGADGKWLISMPAFKAGGPYEMQIDASNHLTIKNILIGDVWVCSGQSNMVHQMELHKERYASEIAAANYPEIRQFHIPTLTDMQEPAMDLPTGYWKSATATDIRQFSAVAYFFAESIYKNHHVPIGLINASVGGTPIEAWTSESGLNDFPSLKSRMQKNKDTAIINSIKRAALRTSTAPVKLNDKGLTGAVRWFDTSYVPKGWRKIIVPGYWEDQGVKDMDGVVWYRKEINIPASMTDIPAKVALGRIVDADFLYVNGKLAGNTSYQYPQRRYNLPAGLFKAGKNILVVRVINNSGKGGFVPDKPYYVSAGNEEISLIGEWEYKVGEVYTPQPFQNNQAINPQNQPAALFNAMIAPLVNYKVKGFLWYQGESNIGNAAEYRKLLPALIKDWRSQWKQADIPFLYVQLPNFQDVQYLPSESQWAILREAQLDGLSVPQTAMAVAIDLGEWNDIHPDNKKDVGLRLALAAEKLAYNNDKIVYSGPTFQSDSIAGNKIILSFKNTGSGLQSKDGEELRWFAISGADKKFAWASTRIEGNKVIVWNDTIAHPMYVRYAWADNPDAVNLYNMEGLPASPFRTDR